MHAARNTRRFPFMDNTPKSVIVGTAGHIDHGKSALVRALTGTDPDRLAEEKRRGITIDLGFAFLDAVQVRLGFVDVPGHERFVSNMLAGAAGIDLVLLVVAANEGIKPQTREHFEICRLLGVKRGVVALAKSDAADRETLGLVKLEVEEYLRGSFLEGAPIVAVSARTRDGVAELQKALEEAAQALPGKNREGYFRLPIDRSFLMKGFGTVVTGTLVSGGVQPEDEVELLPGGLRLRVRGVQSGGRSVKRAFAGQRTAVNLAGIEQTAVARGMALGEPGRFRKTRRVDVRLELLPGAPRMKHRAKVHFHAGTATTTGEVLLGDRAEALPGARVLAQIRLAEDLVVAPGDRFIVRQFSPVETVGGGTVLDAQAPRLRRSDTLRTAFLETIEKGDPGDVLAAMVERAVPGLELQEIVVRTGWRESQVESVAKTLHAAGRVRSVRAEPLLLVSSRAFRDVLDKLALAVENFHTRNPLVPGIAREELRANLGRRVRPETFRAALEELKAAGKLDVAGELVKRAGAQILLAGDESKAQEEIEQAFLASGLMVPAVGDVLAKLTLDAKRAGRLLQILLREKKLVRVSAELVFHRKALEELRSRLGDYRKSRGERISVPAFKELAGISRKYAIPLLEYLDRERVTRRAGDERVIAGP